MVDGTRLGREGNRRQQCGDEFRLWRTVESRGPSTRRRGVDSLQDGELISKRIEGARCFGNVLKCDQSIPEYHSWGSRGLCVFGPEVRQLSGKIRRSPTDELHRSHDALA